MANKNMYVNIPDNDGVVDTGTLTGTTLLLGRTSGLDDVNVDLSSFSLSGLSDTTVTSTPGDRSLLGWSTGDTSWIPLGEYMDLTTEQIATANKEFQSGITTTIIDVGVDGFPNAFFDLDVLTTRANTTYTASTNVDYNIVNVENRINLARVGNGGIIELRNNDLNNSRVTPNYGSIYAQNSELRLRSPDQTIYVSICGRVIKSVVNELVINHQFTGVGNNTSQYQILGAEDKVFLERNGDGGSISMKENACARGGLAGFGQLYVQNNTIYATRPDNSETVDLFSGGTGGGSADGVVDSATLNGTTLELGRTESLADVTVDLSSLARGADNGLSIDGDNVVLGGKLTGNTCIETATGFGAGYGMVIGVGTSATAKNSFAIGLYNTASGIASHVQGAFNTASGYASHAEGQAAQAFGDRSHAEGSSPLTCGYASHAEGVNTSAIACGSHSQGICTGAYGVASHSAGLGFNDNKDIFSCGRSSFIHSFNDTNQIAYHGALADQSAILGGLNHNIESGNTNAAIIGGNSIKLTGTTYIDHTAVSDLAIMSLPVTSSVTSDNVLVRDGSTGIIKTRTQSEISSASDERLKNIVNPITNTLDGLATLSAIEYEFNDLYKPEELRGITRYGLIAQEVEKVFPHVVKDDYKIGENTYKSVRYNELVPILIRANQELLEKLTVQDNRITELENRLN